VCLEVCVMCDYRLDFGARGPDHEAVYNVVMWEMPSSAKG